MVPTGLHGRERHLLGASGAGGGGRVVVAALDGSDGLERDIRGGVGTTIGGGLSAPGGTEELEGVRKAEGEAEAPKTRHLPWGAGVGPRFIAGYHGVLTGIIEVARVIGIDRYGYHWLVRAITGDYGSSPGGSRASGCSRRA